MRTKSSLKRQVYPPISELPARGHRNSRFDRSVWGSADLLYAFYQGNTSTIANAPGLMGATYFIPTVLVALLLVKHMLVFRLLLKGESPAATRDNRWVV